MSGCQELGVGKGEEWKGRAQIVFKGIENMKQ